MAKVTLNTIGTLTNETSAKAALNENFERIADAIENTFSLDGTAPNTLTATVDANSQRIINLAAPVGVSDAATKAYVDSIANVDIGDITDYVADAETAATAAEAAQAAAEAAVTSMTGTSTTSLAIGTGTKVFTTQADKAFAVGTFVLVSSDANPTANYMFGQVTGYSSTTLTVNVITTGGSGTLADWTIRVSGARGAAGTADYSTLDIAGSSAMTDVAITDSIPVYDLSATTNKRATVSELFDAVNLLTAETAVDDDDVLYLYDVSANTSDKATVKEVFKSINTLTADTAPAQSADYLVTYDASAAAAKKVLLNKVGVGKHTIWIPAGSWTPSNGNGPATLTNYATGNGQIFPYLAFDPNSYEFAFTTVFLPQSWNAGTLTYKVHWFHPTTSTNFSVIWAADVSSTGDADALSYTHGTVYGVTDIGGTANTLYISDASAAMTVANTPAKSNGIIIRVMRAASEAGDTLAVDANFLGMELHYTTDTNTDD